jgi:hypothetical protein
MNQLLQNRYNELGPDELFQLRHKLSDSPRALRLIELLEKRRDKKININDAVDFIYKGEDGNFETLRNRFFKLRKQVIELCTEQSNGNASSGISLLPLEEQLYKCRQLVSENHFQLARNELRQLISECRRQNIFELLPDALGQLIYCNMAMNVLKDNEKLLNEISDASELQNDLRQTQASSRKIYLYAVSRQYQLIPAVLRQMRRMAIMRSGFPRFRMLYHFTIVGYTIGVPGFTTRAHARHLSSLKKLLEKFPGMPAGYYEPNGSALMQFYMLTAEGTHLYMKGDVASCYKFFSESWEIMERTPNLRIRKAESYFSNRIAIEVATGRYREALKTAEDRIEFQKEQRQEEKRLKGFAEMATIYSYAYPTLKCPDPEFLTGQLKNYVSLLRKNDSASLHDGQTILAIFYFLNAEWKACKKIMDDAGCRNVFSSMKLDIYNELLVMSPATPLEKIELLKIEIEKQLHKVVSSDHVFSIRRALILLNFLLEQKRTVARKTPKTGIKSA